MASRRLLGVAGIVAFLVLLLGAAAHAAGPPFEDPTDKHVYDNADAFTSNTRKAVEQVLSSLKDAAGTKVVMYTQVKTSDLNDDATRADAQALLDQWKLGGSDGDAAVIFWNFNKALNKANVSIVAGPSFLTRVSQPDLDSIVTDKIASSMSTLDWNGAAITAAVTLSSDVTNGVAGQTSVPGATDVPLPTPTPGGPATARSIRSRPSAHRTPTPSRARPSTTMPASSARATEKSVSQTIADIEDRTGAEIVVYTQVKPQSNSESAAEADAKALIDQWGVGRKGFDDSLVILFDMDESKCHGQVQLYAGSGYRAAYLSDQERQSIFENDMLPSLRDCDMDQALLNVMDKIDAAATPEHAQSLDNARQHRRGAGARRSRR